MGTKDSPEIIWQVYERGDNEFAFKSEKLKRYIRAKDWFGGWKVLANSPILHLGKHSKLAAWLPRSQIQGNFCSRHCPWIFHQDKTRFPWRVESWQSKYCCTDGTRFSF